MIALLLSNRTLAEALGALVLIVGMYLAWIHHDHAEQAIGEHTCEARLTITKLQAETAAAAQEAKYQTLIAKPAEAQHAKDLAAIPLRIVSTPIWLHDGQICAGTVPRLPEASGSDSAGGGAIEGPGRDIRPLIEALKVKYETVLADCRRLDSEWPRP
jgi:hypothetical protein